MPRVVDATQRRVEIAQAAWRIIRRDGLEHASVRNVAGEAGLATGSVRHYFPTQAALHEFAMRLVVERIRTRIVTLDAPADPVARAEWILEEFLPLDAERRAEAQVWLAFSGRALIDPGIRRASTAGDKLLRAVCRQALRDLRTVAPAIDADDEAERLAALVSGLALSSLRRSDHRTIARVRELLSGHIDTVLTAAQAATEGRDGQLRPT